MSGGTCLKSMSRLSPLLSPEPGIQTTTGVAEILSAAFLVLKAGLHGVTSH